MYVYTSQSLGQDSVVLTTRSVNGWCPMDVFSRPLIYFIIHHFLLLLFVSCLKLTYLEVKVERQTIRGKPHNMKR